jgi:hypothetical protein
MILLWLVGFWFTMALAKPEVREDKWWFMVLDLTVYYIVWPLTLGKYLRSKLEKE